jgi:hypothetical protein
MRIGATSTKAAVIMYGDNAGPSLTLTTILRDYRCQACAGSLTLKPEVHEDVVIAYQITCPNCKVTAPDIVHVEQLRQEHIAYQRVMDGLPEHLRQALTGEDDAGAAAVATLLLYP